MAGTIRIDIKANSIEDLESKGYVCVIKKSCLLYQFPLKGNSTREDVNTLSFKYSIDSDSCDILLVSVGYKTEKRKVEIKEDILGLIPRNPPIVVDMKKLPLSLTGVDDNFVLNVNNQTEYSGDNIGCLSFLTDFTDGLYWGGGNGQVKDLDISCIFHNVKASFMLYSQRDREGKGYWKMDPKTFIINEKPPKQENLNLAFHNAFIEVNDNLYFDVHAKYRGDNPDLMGVWYAKLNFWGDRQDGLYWKLGEISQSCEDKANCFLDSDMSLTLAVTYHNIKVRCKMLYRVVTMDNNPLHYWQMDESSFEIV